MKQHQPLAVSMVPYLVVSDVLSTSWESENRFFHVVFLLFYSSQVPYFLFLLSAAEILISSVEPCKPPGNALGGSASSELKKIHLEPPCCCRFTSSSFSQITRDGLSVGVITSVVYSSKYVKNKVSSLSLWSWHTPTVLFPPAQHRTPTSIWGQSSYLGHVDGSHRQRLVAQDSSVLVPLPPLQHDLQLVSFSF